jgi:ribosomal protein S12 methylthiotransferase
MKRPANAEGTLKRIRLAHDLPGNHHPQHLHHRLPRRDRARSSTRLLEFLEEAQLDRVGCFAYSPVEGAAANALPDHVPEAVKEERRARFMAVQEKISAARLKQKVGRSMTVLVDEVGKNGAVARSSADAPEIDGRVIIRQGAKLKPGEFAEVKITKSDAHDLWATPTGLRSVK